GRGGEVTGSASVGLPHCTRRNSLRRRKNPAGEAGETPCPTGSFALPFVWFITSAVKRKSRPVRASLPSRPAHPVPCPANRAGGNGAMPPTAADVANDDLVDRLIAQGALWSRPLIAAFRATPRHRFLDRVFLADRSPSGWREVSTRDADPEQLRLVYSDRALITRISPPAPGIPSVATSSSSQPSLM